MDDEDVEAGARAMIGLAVGVGLAVVGVVLLGLCYDAFVALGQALGSR